MTSLIPGEAEVEEGISVMVGGWGERGEEDVDNDGEDRLSMFAS